MKKLMLTGSLLIALSGIWMTSCEPSRKGGSSPGTTDSLSMQNGTGDSTMHSDTSHQRR